MPGSHSSVAAPRRVLPRGRVLRAGAALAGTSLGTLGRFSNFPSLLGALAPAVGGGVALADASGVEVAGVTVAPPSAFLSADRVAETYRQKWALSCEYAAVHTALRLLGFDVSEDVMHDLAGSGEDPDETFRGAIQANQNLTNYGIHAKGIARLIERIKERGYLPRLVEPHRVYDLDTIRLAVANGQPVVTWVPLDLRASSRVPVRLSTGKIVNLVPAEHALTLRGYDGSRILALDPHAGAPAAYDVGRFVQAMSLFDDPALAIVLRPAVPVSETFAETGVTLDGGFYRTYRELGGRDALGVPLNAEMYEQ